LGKQKKARKQHIKKLKSNPKNETQKSRHQQTPSARERLPAGGKQSDGRKHKGRKKVDATKQAQPGCNQNQITAKVAYLRPSKNREGKVRERSSEDASDLRGMSRHREEYPYVRFDQQGEQGKSRPKNTKKHRERNRINPIQL